MELIEPLCHGRHVIVVGSAPGAVLPPYQDREVVIGANGGAAVARQLGRMVDVLVTTSHLFRRDASASEWFTQQSLSGLRVASMWVDIKNGPMLSSFEVIGDRIQTVNPIQRSRIVRDACGSDLWVSTGLFAICLALVSGALSVEIAGISLHAGHAGQPRDRSPRHHVAEDSECLHLFSGLDRVMVEGVAT